MRRYTIEINGQPHVIDVTELTADTFQVTVGGQQVQVRLADHDDLAGAVIAPHIEPPQAPGQATPGLSPVTVPASPPPAPAAPRGAGPRMTAPMPGVILAVTTRVGADVKRGEELLVLEAMKMKNSLQAPRDGRVAEICVVEKQQVKYGDPLIRFEEG